MTSSWWGWGFRSDWWKTTRLTFRCNIWIPL